jgi:protein TonB
MFVIAVAAAFARAASASAATPPVSRGPLERYISPDDYPQGAPASAARPVSVALDVGPDGRVANCTITTSSGNGALDATTCRLLRSRTRFTPATSAAGVPLAGEVRATIDWAAIRRGDQRPVASSTPVVRAMPIPPPVITQTVPMPASESGPLGARARFPLGLLVSSSDYPPEAIRAGEQGTTGFRLVVAADGSVSDCTVVQSSGSATLDAATCRLMSSRARFTPALDAKGKPSIDTVNARIAWRLPPQNVVVPDVALIRFVLGADGKPRDCTAFSQSVGRTQETKAPDCGDRPPPEAVIAVLRSAGGAGTLRVRFESRLLRDAAEPWPKLERAGLKIIGFELIRMRVAPGGKVLDCFVLDRQSGGLPANNLCRASMRVQGYTGDGEAEMRIVNFTALETAA